MSHERLYHPQLCLDGTRIVAEQARRRQTRFDNVFCTSARNTANGRHRYSNRCEVRRKANSVSDNLFVRKGSAFLLDRRKKCPVEWKYSTPPCRRRSIYFTTSARSLAGPRIARNR